MSVLYYNISLNKLLSRFVLYICAMRNHNQCISPGNASNGTTTSAFHLAMCHTVPRPVSFTYQCVICYHDQCLSPGNVSYGTMTRYIARWKTLVVVPYDTLPCERHWSWYRMTHCQVIGTGRGTVRHIVRWKALVMVPYEMCHTVPRPMYFTWQCVTRYHNQCISPGNVLCGTTTSVFHLAMCYAVPQPVYFTWQCVGWKGLVVVLHSTLPGEIHWLWYRITHCQVKYSGCGTT
jgi:hypothetical protein